MNTNRVEQGDSQDQVRGYSREEMRNIVGGGAVLANAGAYEQLAQLQTATLPNMRANDWLAFIAQTIA